MPIATPGAYAATRPYVVPDTLDELTGPTSGTVTLPLRLDWAPGDKTWDIDDPELRPHLYRLVIREAKLVQDLRDYLHRDLLLELWPHLVLPPECSDRWHARFPPLAGLGTARDHRMR